MRSILDRSTMGAGKPLSEAEKAKISALRDYNNMSARQIAREVGRGKDVVGNFLKDRDNYGKNYVKGRPSLLSNGTKRLLLRSAANSTKSAKRLKAENNLPVGVRRVQQILHDSKFLVYKKMAHKPMLSKNNVKGRMKFALDHYLWTNEWRQIIFSDEKKFNLDGPDGLAHYWHDLRTKPRMFSTRQSGGGSVMVWGAIGYLKKMPLSFISTRMNAVRYQEMIRPYFPAYGFECAGRNWQLQQDNAPIHVARTTKAYFQEHGINLFEDWPSKSPDMNIIENVWGLMAREVYKDCRQYDNKRQLEDAIQAAWEIISQDQIQSLFNSLPHRILALHSAKGHATKY